MSDVTGLHHVTAISGDPQQNLDFYVGVLGMRLVKRSVNQDDPGTYHLFYADATGQAGSDLTFFPWSQLPQGRQGPGLTTEVALAVPTGSLPFWIDRLDRYGAESSQVRSRFGESAIELQDPHGLPLALVETADDRDFTAWDASPVDEGYQVRRLHGVRMDVMDISGSVAFLSQIFGFRELGTESGWLRLAAPIRQGGTEAGGSGRTIDIRATPHSPRGLQGVGTVHHVAWRVADGEVQDRVRERVARAGRGPTPVIDRFWFKSVYFQEPGGILYELATDGPGFTVDEDLANLGERLILPPWLEVQRDAIERRLPPLVSPSIPPVEPLPPPTE